jgi:hypothetical protein
MLAKSIGAQVALRCVCKWDHAPNAAFVVFYFEASAYAELEMATMVIGFDWVDAGVLEVR